MTKSGSIWLRVGSRATPLARLQAQEGLGMLQAAIPELRFELRVFSSPGDRDQTLDLRESPPDFFTRDLDEALLAGSIDLAVHSAKDMPDPCREGLDWFWLPGAADPRDVWVFPTGKRATDLPARPCIGVSSDRRACYAARRFPGAHLRPLRGSIEARLAQLDGGRFDAILMAGAAMVRLGLANRIGEWIPLADLPTPEGQGCLGVTFRQNDRRLIRLRLLMLFPVVFVSAGVGRAGLCTQEGIATLKEAEICLYDALVETALLDVLPAGAERCCVGKRAGRAFRSQEEITELLLRHVRRGKRVVRLKGGDAGLFGRLAEETDALALHGLPFRVIPGVSSLQAATTGTGLLLTERGRSSGFCVVAGQGAGGATADLTVSPPGRLPLVLFMARQKVHTLIQSVVAEGWPETMPVAVVEAAASAGETVWFSTLGGLPTALAARPAGDPALLIIGEIPWRRFHEFPGALGGKRVLLTCSRSLMEGAMAVVWRYGGVPVPFPLIRLVAEGTPSQWFQNLEAHDALLLTSPSAVSLLIEGMKRARMDLRLLPRLIVTGAGTAARLEEFGLRSEWLETAEAKESSGGVRGGRLLWLRSDRADRAFEERLHRLGWEVTDRILYRNEPIRQPRLPGSDLVLFLSGSAVGSFLDQWGVEALKEKTVVAFPGSAARALEQAGRSADIRSSEPSLDALMRAAAVGEVCRMGLHEAKGTSS